MVTSLGTAVQGVGAGLSHTCALLTDGSLWCWGGDYLGQIGNGQAITFPTSPIQVAALASSVSDFSVGKEHTCAIKTDGSLWCWGRDSEQELGDGSAAAYQSVPIEVTAIGRVTEVSAGGQHTCAIKTDGSLWCWGADDVGQLGDGGGSTDPFRSTPVAVAALGTDVAEVSAGGRHTCARKTDDSLWCWGADDVGQLGNGTTVLYLSRTPVEVAGLGAQAAQVSAGDRHTCARKTDGSLWCWGEHPMLPTSTPTQVPELGSGAATVQAGDGSCALKIDDSLWCWGIESYYPAQHPFPSQITMDRYGCSR